MPLTREVGVKPDFFFKKPIRAIFSGSSQSGKTSLIKSILENQNALFDEEFAQIKYFYPSFSEECPVDFQTLKIQYIYFYFESQVVS